jgi:A/G-specific adenine glycosylase
MNVHLPYTACVTRARTTDDELARVVAPALVDWYAAAQRDLPWRKTRDPYAIWVSEIMLQQTRVATVIPYWTRWMERFPTVRALAAAPLDDVLAAWAGLGYYSRARNLHAGAAEVVARHAGALPRTAAALVEVRGIGAYTAGAIASIAYGERAPLVDGNVARVAARVFAMDLDVKSTAGGKRTWELAGAIMRALPAERAAGDLNQALMELGATVCTPTSPTCLVCPLRDACRARAAGRQDELPVLPPRKNAAALPLVARTALWIVDAAGRVLLARRRPAGLFGGLWELPAGDDLAGAARVIGGALAATGAVVMTHRQVLSHRRLVVEVVPARLATAGTSLAAPAESGYDALAWHAAHAAPALGLAAATAAILDAHKDATWESTWTSTPRPSSTSPRATSTSSTGSASSGTRSKTRTSRTPPRARARGSTSSSTTRSRSARRSKRC